MFSSGILPGRSLEIILVTQQREHSRKPDEQYDLIERCSFGERLELFARGPREGWTVWGNQAEHYEPTWSTYANHSQAKVVPIRSEKAAKRRA